jgi:hypothetical protein
VVVRRSKVVCSDFRGGGCLVVLKDLELIEIFRFFEEGFRVIGSWRIMVNVLEVAVF